MEIKNEVQSFNDSENIHKILERKAELTVRGEKLAQQKLCEAEAAKYWEKKNSDIAFPEINQEFESQRLQQANQWTDQAQREKISLCREFEFLNRLCRENRAKDSPQIGELRRI